MNFGNIPIIKALKDNNLVQQFIDQEVRETEAHEIDDIATRVGQIFKPENNTAVSQTAISFREKERKKKTYTQYKKSALAALKSSLRNLPKFNGNFSDLAQLGDNMKHRLFSMSGKIGDIIARLTGGTQVNVIV